MESLGIDCLEALPSDPEIDVTEEIPALDMDNGDLSEPDVEAGGTPEVDIPEVEDTGDIGSGTYIPGEEEAPDYDDPVNNMPDPVYTPESAIPDEDTAKIPKGISYLLEDGELKIVMGLGDVLTAWATVYNTEPDEQLDFKYDVNGLRVQKVYTTPNLTETTDYILHGNLITHLIKKCAPLTGTTTTEQLHFFYDKSARPAMVEYNNTLYYYRHNLQGDIVEIVDSSGSPVVNYTYDAWGTPTNIEGTLKTTLGELNPFRYRGYVWDTESGLYYLRSRYYSPMWIRFINADAVLGKIGALGSRNLFAYCVNNPVMKADPDGATDESTVKGFFRKGLLGYEFGIDTVMKAIVAKWNNRTNTEKALRKEYKIPASAKCEISYDVKQITSFDKQADYVAEALFGFVLGLGGSVYAGIAGGILGLAQAKGGTPDVGMYAGITYSFTHEYRVISGDIDNHTGMECQVFTATWVIEEYTNGVNTYFDVTFDDTGIGQVGIFVDHCNLHS